MHSRQKGKDPIPEGKGGTTISPTSEAFAAVLAAELSNHMAIAHRTTSKQPPENIMAVTESDLLEAINKLAVTFVITRQENEFLPGNGEKLPGAKI